MPNKSITLDAKKLIHDIKKPISSSYMLLSRDEEVLEHELVNFLKTLLENNKNKVEMLLELKVNEPEHLTSLYSITKRAYQDIECFINAPTVTASLRDKFNRYIERFNYYSRKILL